MRVVMSMTSLWSSRRRARSWSSCRRGYPDGPGRRARCHCRSGFVCFVHLPPRFYTHWFFVWKLDNPRIFPRKGQTVDLGPRRVWHVTAGEVCLFSRCWYRLVARCLSTFGCCMVWVRQPECRLWGADVERAPWGDLGSGRRLALWTGRLASFFGSWCCAR